MRFDQHPVVAESVPLGDRHETHEITEHTKTSKYFVSFVFP